MQRISIRRSVAARRVPVASVIVVLPLSMIRFFGELDQDGYDDVADGGIPRRPSAPVLGTTPPECEEVMILPAREVDESHACVVADPVARCRVRGLGAGQTVRVVSGV